MPLRQSPDSEAAIQTYLDALRARKLSERTIENYYYTLGKLKDVLYPIRVLDATTEDLLKWQHSIATNAAGTVAGDLARVRCYFRWSKRIMHWIEVDPAEDLVAPKVPARRPRPVPEPDVMRAFIYCPSNELRCWLALMRYAGLRSCEVAWMCRDWIIDDDKPRLVVIGKGNKERVIPVDGELVTLLRPWMDRQGRLFRWPDGHPVTPRYVSNVVGDHLRGLGITCTAHQLRHSFATRSLDVSADLRVVQEMMGHATPATTALYTEINSDRAREVATSHGTALGLLETRRRRR
jgi:site-specific recombinase XerD